MRLYIRQCSINVNCRDMAMMAATLANGGRNPETQDQIYSPDNVMCYMFSIEKIFALSKNHPNIPIVILSNMVRNITGQLRNATQEIRDLD